MEPPKPKAKEPLPVSRSEAPKKEKLREIRDFRATEGSYERIVLKWSEPDDVKEYKLYWDKSTDESSNQPNEMQQFATVKAGKTAFTVDKESSQGILGSDTLKYNGGNFKF